MTLVALENAGAQLPQLIADVQDGEEIIITRDSAPVAKLVPFDEAMPRPRFGSDKDVIVFMADDFDAPLEDFKDYM